MSTTHAASRSSTSRMKRHRERRRQGTRCVTVDVNQSEVDALVVRGYLSEEERDNGSAIKKAIEGVISDIEKNLPLCQYLIEQNRFLAIFADFDAADRT